MECEVGEPLVLLAQPLAPIDRCVLVVEPREPLSRISKRRVLEGELEIVAPKGVRISFACAPIRFSDLAYGEVGANDRSHRQNGSRDGCKNVPVPVNCHVILEAPVPQTTVNADAESSRRCRGGGANYSGGHCVGDSCYRLRMGVWEAHSLFVGH